MTGVSSQIYSFKNIGVMVPWVDMYTAYRTKVKVYS